MKTAAELKSLLTRIDRRGYPAYKDIRGMYSFPEYVLSIDHVQGDPFAAPSKLSVYVDGRNGGFPRKLYDTRYRRIALQDQLTRGFGKQAERVAFKAKGSGKSGLISVSRCGQEILERTACSIDPENGRIVMRFEVDCLPMAGPSTQEKRKRYSLISCLSVSSKRCCTEMPMAKNFRQWLIWRMISIISGRCCLKWASVLLWQTECAPA